MRFKLHSCHDTLLSTVFKAKAKQSNEPWSVSLHSPRPDQGQGQVCHVLQARRPPVPQEQVVPNQQQEVAGKDTDKRLADPLADVNVRIVECRIVLILETYV